MRIFVTITDNTLVQRDPDSRAVTIEEPRGVTGSAYQHRVTITLPHGKAVAKAFVARLTAALKKAAK